MGEFFGTYGFFIVIGLVMLVCHLGRGGHGGHGSRRADEPGQGRSSDGGHQH